MKPGLYKNIPDITYNYSLDWDLLRSSLISEFMRSPSHYKKKHDRQYNSKILNGDKLTKAQKFGIAAHYACLQPELFEKNICIKPDIDGRTKKGKEELSEFYKKSFNKITISQKEIEQLQKMQDIISDGHHKTAQNLFVCGENEVSGVWCDSETGVMCKLRIDILDSKNLIFADYKTCQNAGYFEFRRTVERNKYYIQAAHYKMGLEKITGCKWRGLWIAQETSTEAYEVAVYDIDDDYFDIGERQIKEMLPRFRECKEKDIWPGYNDCVVKIFPSQFLL